MSIGAPVGAPGAGLVTDLPWHFLDLGLPGLHVRSRGAGIRVALLDSGVFAEEGLFANLRSLKPDGSPAENIDSNGHGTLCASLLASLDEEAPGVAPEVELDSFGVMVGGAPVDAMVRQALVTAVERGCHVVSCSFTLFEADPSTLDAVRMACNQGVVVVAASGNDPNVTADFPERTPNVLVVGPYGHDRELLTSRFGLFTDVLAPGIDLPAVARDGSRTTFGQSSGATAVTAGVMALVLSIARSRGTARVGLALEALARTTAMQSGEARLLDPDRLLQAVLSLP
ncbi:MAG TPA: S8/S53 family peptidase [Polyangiaceae bacterium]|nr:S8/S53 family peptidase [Polyangiaceae bacterium]